MKLEKIGGYPVVRMIAYGAGLVVSGVLVVFGVLTIDDAERWVDQLDRALLVLGSLIGVGVSGLAVKNVEKAPDVQSREVSSRVETKVDGALDVLEKLVPVVERLGPVVAEVSDTVRSMTAERTPSTRNIPAEPVVSGDPVSARRRLEEMVARGGDR